MTDALHPPCAHCGQAMSPRDRRQKYCRRECWTAAIAGQRVASRRARMQKAGGVPSKRRWRVSQDDALYCQCSSCQRLRAESLQRQARLPPRPKLTPAQFAAKLARIGRERRAQDSFAWR